MCKLNKAVISSFILFSCFTSVTRVHAGVISSSEFKSCFGDLAKKTEIPITELPGVSGTAVPYLCKSSDSKLSTDFTKEQLEAGVPILADKQNVYVYLTDNGFQYAEFPVFYYIVKYHDASGGYDIGRLPKNYMPIQSSDGRFWLVNGDGVMITIDHPNAKPLDPRVHYSDKYIKLFSPHGLQVVMLKATSNLITSQESEDCLLVHAKTALNRLSTQHLDYIYTFPFDTDTSNALRYRNTNPEALQALKDKYKKTKDEVIVDYINVLKSETPSCTNIFSDEDYYSQVAKTLSNFLPNYAREKHYIDGL